MSNITQFVRQHSKKKVHLNQFSEDLENRLEMADFYAGGEHEVDHKIQKKKEKHEVKKKAPDAKEKSKETKEKEDSKEKEKPKETEKDTKAEKEMMEDEETQKETETEKNGKEDERASLLKSTSLSNMATTMVPSKPSEVNLTPYPAGQDPNSIRRVESAVSQFSERPEDIDGEVKEIWDSKITFILATIGFAVGLGNIWRSPYLAQKNGGGAFLIPYWIMLITEGLPLFFLELAIGQRLRKGSIGVWNKVSSSLGGIGIASGLVSFNVALYYNTIVAWCLYYFGRSFESPLPWSSCPTENANDTISTIYECEASSPTQYFWYRETLDISSDINSPDNFNWKIATCLLAAWILVYLCIIKGITENPFVIYITAIYPYVVLVIFFFRAILLDGMADGIIHLFKPKWSKLADPIVWLEAGTQIFFSLGLAFGGLIAYSSYNPTNNNCMRDAVVVALTNCFTSMFAVIVIFAIMGFKAHTVHNKCLESYNETLARAFNESGMELPIPDNGILTWLDSDGEKQSAMLPVCNLQDELDRSASGTGLAFILFTEAMNQFPFGNFWAVLFFLMLFTLGIDSQFGTLQGVIQCVVDLKIFPNVRKEIITGFICAISFVFSMMYANGAGNYIFMLYDNFAGTVPLLVIACCEIIAVSYCYGLRRFARDIQLMTGKKPSIYWLICWKYVSPIAMILILIASVVQMGVIGLGYDVWNKDTAKTEPKEWPLWANLFAGVLIAMSLIWIPLIYLLRKCGFVMLNDEGPGWFPAEELRAFYNLPEEYEVSEAEKLLLGFNDDGTEGIFFKFTPDTDYAPTSIIIGDDDDDDDDDDDIN